jgi:hypothetical protein
MYDIEELNEEVNWLSYMHDVRYDNNEVDTWSTDELVKATSRVDHYHDSLELLNWSEPTKNVYRENLETFEAEVFAHGMESPGYVREAYVRKLTDDIGPEHSISLIDGYLSTLSDEELTDFLADETRRGAETLGLIPGASGVYPSGRASQRDEYREASLETSGAFLAEGTLEVARRVFEGLFGPEDEQ